MTFISTPASSGVGVDFLKSQSPVIDYTSLDRASLSQDLRRWASFSFHDRWTNFQNTEFAVIFLEMLAYIGDMIFYQINAVIGESHPSTCIRRQSFINIAKSYDFFLHGPVGSTVPVTFFSDPGVLPYPVGATTFRAQAGNGTIFMPVEDVSITSAEQEVTMRAGDLLDNLLLAVSDGSPGQRYPIPQTSLSSPLLYRNVSGEGLVPTLRIFVDGDEWARVRLEADAQSTDEGFFMRTDEAERVTVFFGDGINGKTPPNGAEIRYSCYLGTNKTSNVNARTIRAILTPIPGLNSITNKVQAGSGSPRQSLSSGKAALPASISTNNRAVVRKDFADVLFRNNAPGGIAKASATRGGARQQIVWVVPNGNTPLDPLVRNEISEYLRDVKILGHAVDVRRAVDIPIFMELDVFVSPDHRNDDVEGRVRNAFVTEVVNAVDAGTAAFDFKNLGLGGRDDAGNPQITVMRVSNLLERLKISGLQKVVVKQLRIVPTAKAPATRINSGNGGLTAVQYVKPRDVARREFRVVFTTSTQYTVYRRVVGGSTFLTDNQLVDDRLDLDLMPEREGLALSALDPITLFPDRERVSEFSVDSSASSGSVVQVAAGSAGSVFGSASVGAEYVLEFEDGNGSLTAAVNGTSTFNSSFADITFSLASGTIAFAAGDELLFDVFPPQGDVLLRPDEHPVFRRDLDGAAIDFITNTKTNV